jgi:hypothetical protein
MKIRAVGAELFHADGQIDTKKLIVAFRSLENAPKNESRFRLSGLQKPSDCERTYIKCDLADFW